jgi:hypothetical protein
MERMPHYANNLPPTATAGAYSGMQPNVSPWANNAPTYTSPAYTSPLANNAPTYTSPAYTSPWANNAPMYTSPTYTSPEYTSPADYSPMGYGHVHSHMHYGHMKSSAYGGASSVGIILVLFILLVIISRACLI